MASEFDGRTALITGSTDGIGVAIAQALGAAGAFMVVSGRNAPRADAVVGSIAHAGGDAAFVAADLGDGETAVRALAEEAEAAASGHIDILVNNAAMLIDPGPTADISADRLHAALAVNVIAPFLLTGLLAPRMAARGWGVVINVGSINGIVGMGGSALYSTTKAALHSLTKSWAAEFAASGVRVNTLAPGPTATERNTALASHLGPILSRIPSGRMSSPAEIGAAAVFLASDGAANIHGATLSLDGGFTAV